MSEIRINIVDAHRVINGTLHGSMTDYIVAALAAEPETIEELEHAMARFGRRLEHSPNLDLFRRGFNENPWDAGIVVVDMAARIVASESSYSIPEQEGAVEFDDGSKLTDLLLPYRVSDDWLFLSSIDEYKDVAGQRRAQRAAIEPLDARSVLYGAVAEYVANECRAALESNKDDPVAEIHAKWLMTPRKDLRDLPPREILLMKHNHIDLEMQSRELQWSHLKEPPPCLKKESFAYRFGGFGTHEIVVYYNLVRMLITACWERMSKVKDVSVPDEIVRLERLKAEWLDTPDPEYRGKTPSCLIEYERIRLPWVMSEEDSAFKKDCPCCQAMAKAHLGPGFWHLDGYSMDEEDFAFSFSRTEKEWEETHGWLRDIASTAENTAQLDNTLQ